MIRTTTNATGTARYGFTLVELLVVVTVIVVLISVLGPALGKAMYQAQLVQCGSNLRMFAAGVMQYASDNDRSYPLRTTLAPNGALIDHRGVQSYKLSDPVNGGANGIGTYDIRPSLRKFIDMNKILNDPLASGVLDFEEHSTVTDTHLYGPYSMWFGWAYGGELGGPGMTRVGDSWTWMGRRYNLLAGDYSVPNAAGGAYCNHSDRRLLSPLYVNYEVFPLGGFWASATWHRPGEKERDPVDLNFAYDDLAVMRLNGVKWADDPQTDLVCNFNAGTGESLQVPGQ